MALLETLTAGLLSAKGARDQNKANQANAREMMAFQERMSSTAYQRAMADMRKAGLNPILAYKQGGASTPSGTTWQAQNVMGKGVGAAASAYQVATQGANLRANTRKTEAEAESAELDRDKKAAGGDTGAISTAIDAIRAGKAVNKAIGRKRPKIKTQKLPPRWRGKAQPPYKYRKIRPGEKAGDYFSTPAVRRRQGR